MLVMCINQERWTCQTLGTVLNFRPAINSKPIYYSVILHFIHEPVLNHKLNQLVFSLGPFNKPIIQLR